MRCLETILQLQHLKLKRNIKVCLDREKMYKRLLIVSCFFFVCLFGFCYIAADF